MRSFARHSISSRGGARHIGCRCGLVGIRFAMCLIVMTEGGRGAATRGLRMRNVAFTLVMLPPQTPVRRNWAARVAQEEIGVRVLQPETIEEAVRDIADADAAFGALPPEVLRAARRLRWLQAPQIAPPAGFYYPELVGHPVVVTNFREIFNDHIGAQSWPLCSRSRGAFTTTCRSRCVVSTRPGRTIPVLCICPRRPPLSSASAALVASRTSVSCLWDARHRRRCPPHGTARRGRRALSC